MRRKLGFIALPGLIILTMVTMLTYMYRGERSKASFTNYQEAVESGYMEEGWLPLFLPESSVNILETHDAQSKEVQAQFSYLPNDRESVEKACEIKNVMDNGVEYSCQSDKRYVIIKLLDNGEGYLFSSPLKTLKN